MSFLHPDFRGYYDEKKSGLRPDEVSMSMVFRNNRHKDKKNYPDAIAIPVNSIRTMGSDSDRYLKKMESLGYIRRRVDAYKYKFNPNDFTKKGYCAAYDFTPKMYELQAEVDGNIKKKGFPTGKIYNHRGFIKEATPEMEQEFYSSRAVTHTHMTINVPAVEEMLEYECENKDKQSIIRSQSKSLLSQADDAGNISIPYHREQGNRFYAYGFNLQSCCKEVKEAASSKHYQYDIDACYISIINHHTPSPILTDYVKNKKEYRDRIAEETGVSPTAVKSIILSLTFGASFSGNPNTYIRKKYPDNYENIINNETLTSINQALVEGKEYICQLSDTDTQYHEDYSNRYVNIDTGNLVPSYTRGFISVPKYKDPRKKAFHYLAYLESRVMLNLHRRGLVRLMVHDGFVTDKRLDKDWLTLVAKEEIGIPLTFEETLPCE